MSRIAIDVPAHRAEYLAPITRRRFFALGGAGLAGWMFDRDLANVSAASATLKLNIAPLSFEAAPGHDIRTTAYNGQVAGVLRLREGEPTQVEIQNHLASEEYVHWHGLAVDARLDGTPEEGSLAVPGGGRLDYTLPAQHAGSFYVHSHAMACHNTAAGMYGGQFAFVYVEPHRNPGRYDREVFLTTHEWEPYMVNESEEERTLEEMHHLRIDPEEAEGVGEGGWDIRYRVCSVNGRALGHGEPVRVRHGERVLFHLLNGSATENVELALPAHTFLVIAMDGVAVPRPTSVETLSLGVGERVDALVEMTAPGVWVLGSTDEQARTMGLGIVVEYAGATGEPVWVGPAVTEWDYGRFADKSVIAPAGAEEIGLALTRRTLGPDGSERWAITDAQGETLPGVIKLLRDQPCRIRLRNDSDEWHPMHLHRHTVSLIRYRGEPIGPLIKDTFLVPPFDSVEFLLTPRSTGPALFHCHNQMHMDAGLQVLLEVH